MFGSIQIDTPISGGNGRTGALAAETDSAIQGDGAFGAMMEEGAAPKGQAGTAQVQTGQDTAGQGKPRQAQAGQSRMTGSAKDAQPLADDARAAEAAADSSAARAKAVGTGTIGTDPAAAAAMVGKGDVPLPAPALSADETAPDDGAPAETAAETGADAVAALAAAMPAAAGAAVTAQPARADASVAPAASLAVARAADPAAPGMPGTAPAPVGTSARAEPLPDMAAQVAQAQARPGQDAALASASAPAAGPSAGPGAGPSTGPTTGAAGATRTAAQPATPALPADPSRGGQAAQAAVPATPAIPEKQSAAPEPPGQAAAADRANRAESAAPSAADRPAAAGQTAGPRPDTAGQAPGLALARPEPLQDGPGPRAMIPQGDTPRAGAAQAMAAYSTGRPAEAAAAGMPGTAAGQAVPAPLPGLAPAAGADMPGDVAAAPSAAPPGQPTSATAQQMPPQASPAVAFAAQAGSAAKGHDPAPKGADRSPRAERMELLASTAPTGQTAAQPLAAGPAQPMAPLQAAFAVAPAQALANGLAKEGNPALIDETSIEAQLLAGTDRAGTPGGFERALQQVSTGLPELPRGVGLQLAEAAGRFPGRPVELTLSPEELGRVRMTLHTVDGALTLTLSAERPDTLDMMRRHIDDLARDFHELGYSDVTFNFEDRPPGGEGAADGQPTHAEDDTGNPTPVTQPAPARTAAIEPVRIALAPGQGLDLRF